jgi:hypothetical protein
MNRILLVWVRKDVRYALACALGLIVLLSPVSAAPVEASAQRYYVNCRAGDDSKSGTSKSQAWRSLARANKGDLRPGDRLLFKRGCSWIGPLNARWIGTAANPIIISAYGRGKLPTIENARDNIVVTGSHLVFQKLKTRADPVGTDPSCDNQPIGWLVGWRFMSGSSHNVVQHSKAHDLYMAVYIAAGSHDNTIIRNTFTDINVADTVNTGTGGMAIVVHGDSNEISHNTISGSDSCSRAYGRDGSAIEIFGGRDNSIHHNRAINNNTFVELGHSRTAHNTIAYNVVTSSLKAGMFLVARGAQDTSWGPTTDTRVYNNSVYLTGTESFAVVCGGDCNAQILRFKNNIIWSRDRVAWVDGAWAETNNVWWSPGGPRIWFSMSATSIAADPKYVYPAGGDLSIRSGSPAINAGTLESVSEGYAVDYDGVAVPRGGAVDIGAFEGP